MRTILLFGRFVCVSILILMVACEVLDNNTESLEADRDTTYVELDKVAGILAALPIQSVQMNEVYDAVSSSSANGYDEEYTMRHLFGNPGAGVGDKDVRSKSEYTDPLWKMIESQVRSMSATKSSGIDDPDEYLKALTESDVQIYWPFSENWNGKDAPVITFDPEDGSKTNNGFKMVINDDGSRHIENVTVDEKMAMEVPVWVVNRNTDSGYTSLELLRREDPAWGEGGGSIIIDPRTKTKDVKSEDFKTLILKSFTMNRNYDSWFAGASEFFVKMGYLEDFTASTEAELRLYSPMITDFMIVVRRNQVGIPQDFNAILMSGWTDDSDACAFMITEDDGGTQIDWTTKAKVYVAGKSYGVEITLPLNIRDDIVWRGKLDYDWFEQCSGESWPFGDVDITFDII